MGASGFTAQSQSANLMPQITDGREGEMNTTAPTANRRRDELRKRDEELAATYPTRIGLVVTQRAQERAFTSVRWRVPRRLPW